MNIINYQQKHDFFYGRQDMKFCHFGTILLIFGTKYLTSIEFQTLDFGNKQFPHDFKKNTWRLLQVFEGLAKLWLIFAGLVRLSQMC